MHTKARKSIKTILLQQYGMEGEAVLSHLVIGDEMWVYIFGPESKN
jgi:hypothetical protein